MVATKFGKLSQDARNKWMHALLNNMHTPSHLSRLKETGLIETDDRISLKQLAQHVAPETAIPAPAVTYDNEVLARQIDENPVCGMGMKPGGGQNQDGWVEVPDVIYPLLGLLRHDDGYKLECIASHAQTIWRVLEPGGTIISQRTDLAQEANQAAKTWASFRVADHLKMLQCYKDNQADGTDEDSDSQGADFDHFDDFGQYKIRERDQVQWSQKLIDKYTKCPAKPHVINTMMDRYEDRVFKALTEGTFAVDPAKISDDQVDALKHATAIRLRDGEPINTNKHVTAMEVGTRLRQEIGSRLARVQENCEKKFMLKGVTSGRLSGRKADMIIMDEVSDDPTYGRELTAKQSEGRALRKQLRHAEHYGMGTERFAQLKAAYERQDAESRGKKLPGRRGHPWKTSEEEDLRMAFMSGDSLERIAEFHGRTRGAIGCRLEKLGLVRYETQSGEYIPTRNPLYKVEKGAMAALDFKTSETMDPFVAQYLDKPTKFGVLEIDSKIPLGNSGMGGHALSGTKAECVIIDDPLIADVLLREDEPKKLEAIPHPSMFEAGCTYIHVHPKADEEFALYRTGTAPLSMGYIRDLQSMQDKFYKVKGELPVYNNYAKAATGTKYVLPNGMVVEQCCIQQVYKTPKDGSVYLGQRP